MVFTGGGGVRTKLRQGLLEEGEGSAHISVLDVVEARRDLDEPLEEQTRLPVLLAPARLPAVVRLEEVLLVEQLDALAKGVEGWSRFCHGGGKARRRNEPWRLRLRHDEPPVLPFLRDRVRVSVLFAQNRDRRSRGGPAVRDDLEGASARKVLQPLLRPDERIVAQHPSRVEDFRGRLHAGWVLQDARRTHLRTLR